MARALTKSAFFEKMIQEYSWRRREIILYNTKVDTTKGDIQKVLLRAAIPFIYGHWEGFVKCAMSLYLRYVSELQLKHKELKSPFIALSLSQTLSSFDSKSLLKKVELVELLLNKMDSRSNVPKRNVINTKSNLRYEVLKEILFHVNLDDAGINSKKEVIDSLVDTRNFIAHGEDKHIAYETYKSFYDEVQYLLERIKTIIENSVEMEGYLK